MGAAKHSEEDRRRRSRWRRLHLSLVQLGLVALFVASACFRIWTAAASTRVLFDARVFRSGNAAGIPQPRRLSDVGFPASDGGVGLVVELHEDDRQCGNIGKLPRERRCEHARRYCKGSRSIVNYVALHYCTLDERAWLSVPLIVGAIAVSFFWLAETAENYFSPVAGLMVEMLKMSPTMGGVTLLALGNGAPDVFASMAAIGGGNSRIGLGAIISAGTFVSAFVVGSVALMAAPFPVKPLPFVRDVLFYTTAVALLFILYLKGVVTFWQAVGLMLFYVVFIVVVVFMDQVKGRHREESQLEKIAEAAKEDAEHGDFLASFQHDRDACANSFVCNEDPSDSCGLVTLAEFAKLLIASPAKLREKLATDFSMKGSSILSSVRKTKVKSVLQAPLQVILRATIPEINPSKWNRVYATANVVSCPLLVLFMFRSAISLDYQVAFFLPMVQLPLWSLVLVQNLFLAIAFFLSAKQPPDSTQLFVAFMAFVMSVFWISFIAGELLGCLAALGLVLGVSPALLGLTILAWGNSMGDLVADIAIARAGKPDMAIAGCFAGPMFNMLVGLGFALVLHTSYLQSGEFYLPYHPSIIIAFGFLFASLLGSLVVVACSGFQVTRTWGLCLICLYFIFTIVSLGAANIPL